MLKYRKYIILFFIPFFLQCKDEVDVDVLLDKYTSEELAGFARDAIIEPVEKTFAAINGSKNFIEKFSLNNHEQDMIGVWLFTYIFAEAHRGNGLSAGGISFFPNRLFSAYKGSSDELNYIRHVVGKWKVEDGKLMLQFICRIKVANPQARSIDERFNVEYREDDAYYPIYEVQEYKRYYINNKPFNWKAVPREVRQFYEIERNDSRRDRILFDTIGRPPGDLRKESHLGSFLLNPQQTDEYILRLVDVW